MCSNAGQTAHSGAEAELAARLVAAIEDFAAAAGAGTDTASLEVASRLARAWAMITSADPELAARTARYSS
jgi:hypothetical protein